MLLNNEPCLAKATLIDLNPNELNFHPLMNNLDKCSESCYPFDDLFDGPCIPNKTKMWI